MCVDFEVHVAVRDHVGVSMGIQAEDCMGV